MDPILRRGCRVESRTTGQVVYAVLSEKGPMTRSELVACMMEAGYQTTQAPKALRDSVGLVLRKDGERFRKVGVKWGCE